MRSARSKASGLLQWGRVVLVTVPACACTSILGIDGNYVIEGATSGDGGSSQGAAGSDESGGALHQGGAGGTAPADGGSGGLQVNGGSGGLEESGGSGAGGGGSGGRQTSAGGAGGVPDAGPPDPNCREGTYSGSFDGVHAPAVTFVGVPFSVSGNFSFTMTGTGRVLKVSQTTLFTSTLAWGTWTIDLDGEYDCATRMLTGKLAGVLSAAPLSAQMQGTMTGSLVSGGEWREEETVGPGTASACKLGPPVMAPTGTGCGTWSITTRP